MASSATTLPIFGELRCFRIGNPPVILGYSGRSRSNLIPPRQSFNSSSVLTFARRRNTASNSPPVSSKKLKKKQNSQEKDDKKDEDAFEALFQQLEEDLKNDSLSIDENDDDDINEDDIKKLEQELEEALKDDELFGALGSIGNIKDEEYESENAEDYEEEAADDVDDEDDDEESTVNLKTWQLKRLAYALKSGRRKISIKNLAAELCLDREVVLKLLRDPPPNLLMLSATLPDKPVSRIEEPIRESTGTVHIETAVENPRTEKNVKVPVHVLQRDWTARKRIKKSQLETLQLVYQRTKRPTNSMISSVVQVTHLPRKKIIKWFEDKRVEDGVPERRIRFRRSAEAHFSDVSASLQPPSITEAHFSDVSATLQPPSITEAHFSDVSASLQPPSIVVAGQ